MKIERCTVWNALAYVYLTGHVPKGTDRVIWHALADNYGVHEDGERLRIGEQARTLVLQHPMVKTAREVMDKGWIIGKKQRRRDNGVMARQRNGNRQLRIRLDGSVSHF